MLQIHILTKKKDLIVPSGLLAYFEQYENENNIRVFILNVIFSVQKCWLKQRGVRYQAVDAHTQYLTHLVFADNKKSLSRLLFCPALQLESGSNSPLMDRSADKYTSTQAVWGLNLLPLLLLLQPRSPVHCSFYNKCCPKLDCKLVWNSGFSQIQQWLASVGSASAFRWTH